MKLTHYDSPPYGHFKWKNECQQWDSAYYRFLLKLERCWNPYHGSGILEKTLWVNLEGAAKETCRAEELFTNQGDVNHKLIHCMNVAFWATLHHMNISNWEQLVASCLVHDFIKATSSDDAAHDRRLENIFPHLDPMTYDHCWEPNPDHSLVQGDRIELMRFEDHNSWIRWEDLPSWFDRTQVGYFYRYLNPALEQAFFNMDQLWVRHGIEPDWLITRTMRQGGGSKVEDKTGNYPYQWWSPPEKPGYCVEVGFLRDINDYALNRLAQDNAVQALTLGCHLQPMYAQYDHGKVSSSQTLPLSKWIFTVDPYDHLAMVPENCLGIVSMQTLKLFVRVVTKLKAVILSFFPC